jgi:archaellum biogenesis ATPase FlaH
MPTRAYKLTRDSEAAVVRQMLADPAVLPKIHRYVRAAGFEAPEAIWLVGAALDHYKARGRAPTPVACLQDLRDKVNAGRMTARELDECATYLGAAKARPPITSDHAVDLVLKREREDALFAAVEESGRLLAAAKFDEVAKVVTRADVIGKVDLEMGVDWGEDLDRRTEDRIHKVQPRRWGTGIPDLDDLMDGGISADNPLGCIQAGPKNGKSLWLSHVALHSVALGAQVAFFSTENGRDEVIKRMDAAVAGVPIREVLSRATEVQAAVRDFKATCRGRLHVKKFPQKTTKPKEMEAYLDILAVEFGFQPQVVVIDYPGEMAPDEEQEKRHEDLADIFRSIRAMCERRKFIAWTAAQLKSGGVEKKMAGKGDTGGAIAIEQLVDIMLSIGRTAEEVEAGLVRFGVTESRFSRDHVTTGAIPTAYDMGRIVASFLPRPGF